MSDNPTKLSHIEIERRIISLMLRSNDVVEEMINNGFTENFFDEVHAELTQAIYDEFITSDGKRILTRDHYKDRLLSQNKSKITFHELGTFDQCYFIQSPPTVDDVGMLMRQLTEAYLGRTTNKYLEEFRKEQKQYGYSKAVRSLTDKFQSALGLTETKHSEFHIIADMRDSYIQELDKLRKNPAERVTCGWEEIDEAIPVGFRPGHLTLFAADTGGHKSNIMLNIALNLYEKHGHNILFVPIEMSWSDLTNRLISNLTNIPLKYIGEPSLLTDKQFDLIKEASLWMQRSNKFAILDVSEKTSVAVLRAEIEKRINFFKPKLVVIDYIALMGSDKNFYGRNDLEIGDILKSLRLMGKRYGFHVFSAAQIGRGTLTKLRQEGFDAAHIDSTALRGSHEYSADADTIFALLPVPDEEDKLKIYTVKARHGKKGVTRELHLKADCCRISSTHSVNFTETEEDIDLFEGELNETPEESMKQLESNPNLTFASSLDSLVSNNLNDVDDVNEQDIEIG